MMKNLPIGIQDFQKLIEKNYLYIDKTEYLFKLITTNQVYFLSRPRRFGKSLTVSTLKEIFSGNKELFKDTWIYNKIEWEKHPVIHIDLSNIGYKNIGLIPALELKLKAIADEYSITLVMPDFATQFNELIVKLAKEKQVVILIDEYDKPIIDYLSDINTAKENREILKNLYSCLKGLDEYIKFLFITGVSKFSKISIFSDLNHLNDITTDSEYASMLGYTEQEISMYFDKNLSEVEKNNQISEEELLLNIKKWYNGYCWHIKSESVYNPFSILNFFQKQEFSNYWFSTGTPTFIVDFIKNQKSLPEQTSNILVSQMFFDKFDIEHLDIISLMFQTGYLTIKSVNKNGAFLLDYPNYEVKNSFVGHLLECYAHSHLSTTSGSIEHIKMALDENNWATIVEQFNVLFSKIPYSIFKPDSEFFYHAIIHSSLSLLGVDITSELQTSKGRVDTVIKTNDYIYIIEFKIGDAKTAIQQIKEKEYYKPFLSDTRTLVLVGIGFDVKGKEVKDYITEHYCNE